MAVKTAIQKPWHFLTTYVLTLQRFDLFLQGSLLIIVLLDTNITLLLKRDATASNLTGNLHDWVSVGAAAVEFLLGTVVAWWGAGRRNLALSFWLAMAAAAGLLVLAFPYNDPTTFPVGLCDGNDEAYSVGEEPLAAPRIVLLILTASCCAVARLSIFAHGLTYLDDHQPENGAYFYGILITIRLSLGLNGSSWLEPGSRRDDWWVAQLCLCMLTLMFAFLFTLFPRKMAAYKQPADDGTDKAFLATVCRVMSSKPVLLQTAALSCLYAAVFSFIRFDADFVKARFHIDARDPRTSRSITDIFRSLVIIFFVSVFRTRFSVRRSDGVKATTSSRVGGVAAIPLALLFAALAALSCDIQDLGQETQPPACSAHCGCSSERYGFSPVCGLNSSTTYFSPCHAGCGSYEDLNGFRLFSGCACGGQAAARGACSLPGCLLAFGVYQLLFTVLLALSGAALLMQGMVLLRAARPADKAAAVGASFATISLLSQGGFLLYMLISKFTCAYEYNGACLLHHSSVWGMAALGAGLALASAAGSLRVSTLPCYGDDSRL